MDTPIVLNDRLAKLLEFLTFSNSVNCNIWEFSFGSQQTAPTPASRAS